MTWKAGNESTVRGYKFTYDGLDRLLNATYGETAGINANTCLLYTSPSPRD